MEVLVEEDFGRVKRTTVEVRISTGPGLGTPCKNQGEKGCVGVNRLSFKIVEVLYTSRTGEE